MICNYPGCREPATIHCHTIGCLNFVCETHGNCAVEVTPDESVAICWYCCGKGWGAAGSTVQGAH